MLSKALHEIRRAEAKAEPEALKGTRYLFLKRPEHLTEGQRRELAYLKVLHATLATLRAYAWRLQFDAFYDQPAEEAEAFLLHWCLGAVHAGLDPLICFVETVFAHWDGIVRWHAKRINTGVLEAIKSLVQAAKRRARGYRTKPNLIAMTYLIAGKLDLGVVHRRARLYPQLLITRLPTPNAEEAGNLPPNMSNSRLTFRCPAVEISCQEQLILTPG